MNNQDYQNSIATNSSPKATFDKINQVSSWWSKNFEGNSAKLGDVFIVRFKSGDWYQIKVDELIPEKKIVWNVIDSEQTWHEHSKEWTGTKIVFEILPGADGSQVTMTHVGLVPEAGCYHKCKMAWDYLIGKSLQKLLNDNEGMPV